MEFVSGLCIGLLIGTLAVMLVNDRWNKLCKELNEDWSKHCGDLNKDWAKYCEKLNKSWSDYCSTLIERRK